MTPLYESPEDGKFYENLKGLVKVPAEEIEVEKGWEGKGLTYWEEGGRGRGEGLELSVAWGFQLISKISGIMKTLVIQM